MLVTSIFSVSHNVFKRLLLQGCQKSGLCGKELNNYTFLCVCKTSLLKTLWGNGDIACNEQFVCLPLLSAL